MTGRTGVRDRPPTCPFNRASPSGGAVIPAQRGQTARGGLAALCPLEAVDGGAVSAHQTASTPRRVGSRPRTRPGRYRDQQSEAPCPRTTRPASAIAQTCPPASRASGSLTTWPRKRGRDIPRTADVEEPIADPYLRTKSPPREPPQAPRPHRGHICTRNMADLMMLSCGPITLRLPYEHPL